MDKKKKILIGAYLFTIIIVVITVCVLYVKTDLFKTKEQLFWKYMLLEKDEIVGILSDKQMQSYNETLKKSSYIKEGNISITSKFKLIRPIDIKISEKGNNLDGCKNTFITFNSDDSCDANATIIKDENYYIIKSNLIGPQYVGFENDNLRDLAKAIGIQNTNYIPNKIESIDYIDLLSISDVEMNRLLDKYVPIFRRYINNKDYIKKEHVQMDGEDGDITLYEVGISEGQLNGLIIAILKELCEDRETLELIGSKIEMLDSYNQYGNIDTLKDKISELVAYFEGKTTNCEKVLSIIIYKSKKNVVKTELILKDNRTISVETNGRDKVTIRQYDVMSNEIKLDTIEDIVGSFLNAITEITYSRSLNRDLASEVNITVKCNIGLESITLDCDYVKQIKDKVEGIIHKNEIEYVDLMKNDVEECRTMLRKLLEISMSETGKNYF